MATQEDGGLWPGCAYKHMKGCPLGCVCTFRLLSVQPYVLTFFILRDHKNQALLLIWMTWELVSVSLGFHCEVVGVSGDCGWISVSRKANQEIILGTALMNVFKI